MKRLLVVACGAVLLAGCATAPAGPSLDQQQQAWEQDIETQACEAIKTTTPGSVELSWLTATAASGENWAEAYKAWANAQSSDRPYTCGGPVFARYYQEWLVEDFPESPKGQAGETTSPLPR